MDPKVQAVLEQIGRQGWQVISRIPAPDSQPTTDRYGASVPGKYPEGAEQWTITDGKGHSQTMVVKPPVDYPGPYSPNVNDPGAYQPNYQVVEPPKDIAQSQVAGWADQIQIRNPDGSSTLYGLDPKDGQFKKVPNVPNSAAPPSTAKPVTPSSQLETVKAPDGTPIAYRDPSSGQVIDLPKTTPDKPQIIQGPRGQIYKWDGTNLSTLQQGEPAPITPKEGDTRRNVQGGFAVTEKYTGGQWTTDPTVTPVRFDPNAPKEGDVRPNVVQGQAVQEIYRGGQWVVDTSVAPKPFVQQPSQVISAPANQQYIARSNPQTGEISYDPSKNYVAPDTAGRVQQLQQQAAQEQKRLLNDQTLSDDERLRRWEEFWQSTIQPQADQLQRDRSLQDQQLQRQAQQDQTAGITAESNYEQNRQTTARQAGQDAVSRVMQTLPYRVGPNFGGDFSKALSTLSGGGGQVNFSPGDFTFDMPNLDQISEQATAAALAHISPYAAMKANAPMPQIPAGVDPTAALNASRYTFGGGSAPTTTIAPDGTVTIQHQAPDPRSAGTDFLFNNPASPIANPANTF